MRDLSACASVVLQEGLLSCLTVVQNITLARNAFSSYPSGGPAQFASVSVSISLFMLVGTCTLCRLKKRGT